MTCAHFDTETERQCRRCFHIPSRDLSRESSVTATRRRRTLDCPLSDNLDRAPLGWLADTRQSRGLAFLPKGLIGTPCTNCGICGSLIGVPITPTADQNDPNILW